MTRRLSTSTRHPNTEFERRVRFQSIHAAKCFTLLLLVSTMSVGCLSKNRGSVLDIGDSEHYQSFVNQTYYPGSADWGETENFESQAPLTIDDATSKRFNSPAAYKDLSLPNVIQHAFANSSILRDLGGTILRNPENMQTTYSVAITETDPRFGIEAALSDFDAEFSTNAFFEKNDRQVNNQFFGGGVRTIEQDINDYQSQLSKTAATGTKMFLRANSNYDANNAPANAFGSAWTSIIEGEVRHPLLQGAGIDFNRIAGPNGIPGSISGVVIAQTNADITSEDFAMGLRDYISNVENAYWDLYYAYRDLDAKVEARNYSLKVWQEIKAQVGQRRGAEADEEALASEQYYRLQEEVENALTGRQIDGTRTRNGANGGAFRNTGGVHRADRRLRYLIGMEINDGTLIRPTTEPEMAEINFDWPSIVNEALMYRPELKRQRIRIRQRELQLRASKNFLSPRFDAVGRYRWRGFGKDFIDPDGATAEFDNSIEDLFGGKFQEWQLGFEFNVPIGYRRAWAAVQNAELWLAKERALMREQERQVVHDLSDALAEVKRSYRVAQTNLNRYEAAKRLLKTLQLAEEVGRPAELDKLLDAQNRLTAAQSRYFLSRAEYHVAIKNVNFEKGTLLEYNNLYINNNQPQSLQASTSKNLKRPGKPSLKTDDLVKLKTNDDKKVATNTPKPPIKKAEKKKPAMKTASRPVFMESNLKSNIATKADRQMEEPPFVDSDQQPKAPTGILPAGFDKQPKQQNRLLPAFHEFDGAAKADDKVKHAKAEQPVSKASKKPSKPSKKDSAKNKVEPQRLDPFIHESKGKSDVNDAPKPAPKKKCNLLPFDFDAKKGKSNSSSPKLLP